MVTDLKPEISHSEVLAIFNAGEYTTKCNGFTDGYVNATWRHPSGIELFACVPDYCVTMTKIEQYDYCRKVIQDKIKALEEYRHAMNAFYNLNKS